MASRVRSCGAPRAGFTLVELLVVMALMVLITTIMVASYFGAQRAAAYTACNDVRNYLILARQRACLGGKKTYFAFTNTTDYLVLQPIGRISAFQGKTYYDGYTDMADSAYAGNRAVLFNLRTFDHRLAQVETITLTDDTGDLYKGQTVAKLTFFQSNETIDPSGGTSHSAQIDPGWQVGDRYGIAISPMLRLPKGFEASFTGGGTLGGNHFIVFNPDGSVEQDATIDLVETIKQGSTANKVQVRVCTSGKIEVE
ncbi:MAG: pilus assembly FimT family protein [Kiritimatiellia bacterium]|jgi:prepilin-type N-terminal cleavage/methylation domain-containing protein